jgi:hypothetical protein
MELLDGEKRQDLCSCIRDIIVAETHVLVRYPLPFVACIWNWFSYSRLLVLVDMLSFYAQEVEGGKDWEVIIVTALVLGFLRCQYIPAQQTSGCPNCGPFGIATDGVDYIVS